jgi:hypothetical protein
MRVHDVVADLVVDQLGFPSDLDVLDGLFGLNVSRRQGVLLVVVGPCAGPPVL